MLGGIGKKLFWNEYIALFKNEEDRKCLEAVKGYVEENDLFRMGGFSYQNGEHADKIDELSGKNIRGFSFRAWGDLMAAIMNTRLKERKYDYCAFAWKGVIE